MIIASRDLAKRDSAKFQNELHFFWEFTIYGFKTEVFIRFCRAFSNGRWKRVNKDTRSSSLCLDIGGR